MSTDKVTSPDSPLDRFIAVIPAGGVGTRLWPLSRAAAPKFLHDLTGSGSTLLRATYDRLEPLAGKRVLVVTGTAHRDAVCRQLPEVQDADLVLESEPKDSGAAIGLAAAILHERDPDTIMGSFAADQVISPDDLFQEAVREAIHTAAAGKIVTIGIKPTHPSTGFGYIRAGQEPRHVEGAPSAQAVVEFVEKPDEEVAQQYVDSGEYVWNAGMFVAPVALMLKHLEANQPELFAGLQEIARAWDTPRARRGHGPRLAHAAQDRHRLRRGRTCRRRRRRRRRAGHLPAGTTSGTSPRWAGSTAPRKSTTSPCIGEGARVFTENASGVVVSDTKRVIALIGIKDVVIVDTPDALLVTTKEHSQRVKQAVDALKASGDTDVL